MQRTFVLTLWALALPLCARQELSNSQLALLQDHGGWEYILIGDQDAGIQTQHTCFDGHAHPNECSGTLTLTSQNTFVQQTYIHHQRVSRHGTYQLNGNQLTFFDEMGVQDGPYTVSIDTQKKMLTLDNPPLRMVLELHSQYVADRDSKRPPHTH
jgi:hypothetical protein